KKYYESWADSDSPALRDNNPSVVVIPGVGLFGFGRDKKEARITTEFFINAIHVMAGATALGDAEAPQTLPQSKRKEQSSDFTQLHNYVALPRREAFRIEYWPLEEAKLKRMPPEAEFKRKIVLVIGGASGIGREVVLLLARNGAHVVVADVDETGAAKAADEAASLSSLELVASVKADLSSSELLAESIRFTVLQFGGIDAIVSTAAIFPVFTSETNVEKLWAKTFEINVTGNYLLASASNWVFKDQGLPSAMVLTSSG